MEMRRAEVALAETQRHLETTEADGRPRTGGESVTELRSRAAAAQTSLEEATAAFEAGRQAWEAFHAEEEEEQRRADASRTARHQAQPAR
ncbi:MAG: hypothetical protein JO040_14890 [Gemmatimonadetes bacterium]|nr:hypothetical protein [Gemmatimonadota bacterium]